MMNITRERILGPLFVVIFLLTIAFQFVASTQIAHADTGPYAVQVHLDTVPKNIVVQIEAVDPKNNFYRSGGSSYKPPLKLNSIGGNKYQVDSIAGDGVPLNTCSSLSIGGQPDPFLYVVYVYQSNNIKAGQDLGHSSTIDLCQVSDQFSTIKKEIHVTTPTQQNKLGIIAGTITYVDTFDGKTKPLPINANIDITGPNGYKQTLHADTNGHFSINSVPPSATPYHIHVQQIINVGTDDIGLIYDKDVTVTAGNTADASGVAVDHNKLKGSNDTVPDDTRTFKGECGNIAASPSQIIICPFIKTITGAASVLDSYVNNMLEVNSNRVFDTGGTGGYYTAWKSVRTLALAFIVVGGLVMVLAQAAGLEILDAYTVRKVLPRLLIIAIIIALSWPLMKFAVDLTNEVGILTRSLIYGPFKGLSGAPFSLGGGSLALGGLLGLGGFIVLGYIGVLSYLLSALVALVVGFLVLILRQIVVTMLIVLAPLALAAYILPNTQKLYSLWWDSFSKALMMFPIIAAMIAAGRVFAVVASHASQTGAPGLATAYQVGALVAYIAPYFVLPLTLRFAGSALGGLGSVVHNQRKGISEGLKKYRGNKSAQNIHKMKSGSRFSGRNSLSRAFNRTSAGAAAGAQNQFGLSKRGRSAVATAVNAAANEYDKDPRMASIEDDDTVVRAATYDNAQKAEEGIVAHLTKHGFGSDLDPAARSAAIRAEAQRGVKGVQTSIGFGRAQAIASARRMATGGTPFADLQDQAETIARASGRNTNTRETLSHYVSHASKGRGPA
jgi:hypothetical protein